MKGMSVPGRSRRRAIVTAVALATAALVLASCSRRIANPDASYTVPEGVPSDSVHLVVWADEANPLYLFQDQAPLDADPGDVLIRVDPRRRGTEGSVNGMVFDGTTANSFQVFRREEGGGVRQFSDVLAQGAQRWLESGWEIFRFNDPNPSPPPTYIARGLREGIANANSPLSRAARAEFTPVEDLGVRAVWWSPRWSIKITWNEHPDAVRYFIQIYTFRGDLRSTSEKILSGTPGPLYDGQAHNIFVGSVLAPRNFYMAGFHSVRDSVVDHAQILSIRQGEFLNIARVGDQYDTTAAKLPYRVRVSAVDANGRLVATSRGPDDLLTALRNGDIELQRGLAGAGTYGLYRLNSAAALDTAASGPALTSGADRTESTNLRQAGRARRL